MSSGSITPPVPTYATVSAPEAAMTPAPPSDNALNSATRMRVPSQTNASRSGSAESAISSSSEILIDLYRLHRRNEPLTIDFHEGDLNTSRGHRRRGILSRRGG